MYYQAFDEDGQIYSRDSQITITLQDPSRIKMNTWYMGNRQDQMNNYDQEDSVHTLKDNNFHLSRPNNSHAEEFEDMANISQINGKFTERGA